MAARSCGAARQSWEIQIEVSHAEPRRATPRPLAVQCKPAAYGPATHRPWCLFPSPPFVRDVTSNIRRFGVAEHLWRRRAAARLALRCRRSSGPHRAAGARARRRRSRMAAYRQCAHGRVRRGNCALPAPLRLRPAALRHPTCVASRGPARSFRSVQAESQRWAASDASGSTVPSGMPLVVSSVRAAPLLPVWLEVHGGRDAQLRWRWHGCMARHNVPRPPAEVESPAARGQPDPLGGSAVQCAKEGSRMRWVGGYAHGMQRRMDGHRSGTLRRHAAGVFFSARASPAPFRHTPSRPRVRRACRTVSQASVDRAVFFEVCLLLRPRLAADATILPADAGSESPDALECSIGFGCCALSALVAGGNKLELEGGALCARVPVPKKGMRGLKKFSLARKKAQVRFVAQPLKGAPPRPAPARPNPRHASAASRFGPPVPPHASLARCQHVRPCTQPVHASWPSAPAPVVTTPPLPSHPPPTDAHALALPCSCACCRQPPVRRRTIALPQLRLHAVACRWWWRRRYRLSGAHATGLCRAASRA